ncbi:MAG: hypothetical protein B5M55_08180 [Desulfococcus sp. 4484_242]|nr:MAG: hypothetical protein B5M55_08180 [Desulfococcus sp. 4484_242]
MYVSASSLDLLGLVQKFAFPDRKLISARISFMDGHYLKARFLIAYFAVHLNGSVIFVKRNISSG